MGERGYTAKQLAALNLVGVLSSAPNKVLARAVREEWPSTVEPSRGGRGTVRVFPLATLPEVIRTAIAARVATTEATPMVEARPEHAAIALERFRVVAGVVELVERGERVAVAIESVRGEHTARTVRRWYDTVRHLPRHDWTRKLLPAWTGPTATAAMSEEAFAWFKSECLSSSRPAYAACYRRTIDVATARGWSPVPAPGGLGAYLRRYRREVPLAVQVLARDGETALERLHPSLARDKSAMQANDVWTADGHRIDVMVRWPDGAYERPIGVAFQDVKYGPLLGWRWDRTENADLVRLAFADAATTYGLPGELWFDNGRAFAALANTGGCHWRYRNPPNPEKRGDEAKGIFTQLVPSIHWVLPHHGQSKPIERTWRDLCEEISRHPMFEGAYVGSDSSQKPENFDVKNAVDFEVFLKVANALIIRNNERVGRRSKSAAGRSLIAAYTDGLSTIERRVLHPDQERLLWLASKEVTLTSQDGELSFLKNTYWSDELVQHKGERAVARFDPDRLHDGVHVYLVATSRYLGWAPCIKADGVSTVQEGRNIVRDRATFKRANKDLLKIHSRHSAKERAVGHMQALKVDIGATAPPASVIRPNFAAPRLSKAAELVAQETTARRAREREDADEVASLFDGTFDALLARTAGND